MVGALVQQKQCMLYLLATGSAAVLCVSSVLELLPVLELLQVKLPQGF